ncbi:hypothetical protein GCM10023403_60050 [Pseudonocardia benzenivorans]
MGAPHPQDVARQAGPSLETTRTAVWNRLTRRGVAHHFGRCVRLGAVTRACGRAAPSPAGRHCVPPSAERPIAVVGGDTRVWDGIVRPDLDVATAGSGALRRPQPRDSASVAFTRPQRLELVVDDDVADEVAGKAARLLAGRV